MTEGHNVQTPMCSTGFQGRRNRTNGLELQGYSFQLSASKYLGQSELYGVPHRVVSSPSLRVIMQRLDDQPTSRDVVEGFQEVNGCYII